MFKTIQKKAITVLAAASLAGILAASAGCQQDQVSQQFAHGEDFAPDGESRNTTELENAQKARGARVDATLYENHFDGAEVNSLGMAKLDLMVGDDCPMPLTVWMCIPEDEQAQARRVAVGAYLKDRGLLVEQIKFGQGPNPSTAHLASDGIKGLTKTESDVGAAAPADAAGAPSSGSGGH